ncbi:sporulation protein [Thermaerobacillus caldiproteolyticus]|uniref:Sporulation-control protein n=1 Tax=Thermaerobacillus caldiproteolyticus TaxID=247480 RepID=A0A7W0C022_9BACL|nr:sporulation protein [Anoxybacillus caldiproteolyticus]MBA2876220.1 sporulation-control protein [Anoxybacillus caldiproteolyticus]
MFKKFLSKLGIGSANINLVLHHSQVRLGETISGEFLIEGGTVEQEINKIDIELRLTLNQNGQVQTKTMATVPVASAFVIQAGEKKVLPFAYELPKTLSVSRHGIHYTFVTRLDIAGGVDHLDEDSVQILPPLPLEKIFVAFEKLGFREKATSGSLKPYGQEFELFPTEQFKETVQEVEFFASLEEEGVRLLLEVDVYAGVFGIQEKELKREIFFPYAELDVDILADKLHETIQEMIDQPYQYAASSYMTHYSHTPHVHGHGSGLMGAIGGFAAGMFAGMLVEELVGDAIEEALGFDEEAEEEGVFDDFFGEEDEEF